MVNSVNRKFYWKQLAPRPYSSLWIWIAARSLKQQSYDYFLPHGSGFFNGYNGTVVDDDSDEDEDYEGTHGPLDGYNSDGSTDWLDTTLASLDQSILDVSDCVVQSIPVNQSSQSIVDQIINSPKSNVSRGKHKDNKRRKLNTDTNNSASNRGGGSGQELNESPRNRGSTERESLIAENKEIDEKHMKILDISDSHIIIVLRKSQHRHFSIINGDAKVTMLVGSIVCDGYTLGSDKSTHISTGFGKYQITIEPVKFQSYPSKEHLIEVLNSSTITVPETISSVIVEYLTNRDSRLAESVIISFQKWRWPALTALRLLIQPEQNFTHWLQISFADVRSPVIQWSPMVRRLTQEVKDRTESAASKPPQKSSTRGPRVIMLGGVNSGKSSLTRHFCNQIISSVSDKLFVVDCDPGQSEFSPPGIINIIQIQNPVLSPSFVNCLRFNKDIIVSCSVAGTSLNNNPDLYILGIKYLWETFIGSLSEEDSCKPVLINTIGWTQGLGIHLMVDILHIFKPTYVVEIKRQSWNEKDNFPFDCNPDTVNQLNGWLVEPRSGSTKPNILPSSECSLKPYLNYAYIRISNQFVTKKLASNTRWNRIANQLGYFCLMEEILFKSLPELEVISLSLENLYFHVQHEFVIDKHLIPHVIKDSWVHMCSIIVNQESETQSSDLITQPSTSSSSSLINPVPTCSVPPPGFTVADAKSSLSWEPSTNVNLKILPFLRENKCLGSAIVRDIDLINNKLILLTPESLDRIGQVNCIVRPQGIFIPDQLQLSVNPMVNK